MAGIGVIANAVSLAVVLLILVVAALSAVCFAEGRGVHFPEWLHIWANDPKIVLWSLLFVVIFSVMVAMLFR